MYCKNCGKAITEDSRFCPECGAEQFSVTDPDMEMKAPEMIGSEVALRIDAKLRASAILFTVVFVLSLFDFFHAISLIVEFVTSADEYARAPTDILAVGLLAIMLCIPVLCLMSSLLLFKEKYQTAIPILVILSVISILMLILFAFSIVQLLPYAYLEAFAIIRACAYFLLHFFILIVAIPTAFLIVYRSNFWIMRNKWVVFVLCLFFGALGFHRFYAGKIGSGIVYLVTGGCLGIGVLVDLISILIDTFKDAQGRALKG